MTVSIDPSEVRRQSATHKRAMRRPVRTILLGGLGGAGLLVFAYGASTFFSDLADPRVRPRPAPVAANWPDLKDGVPALAPENAAAPAEPLAATVLNLPRPSQTEPEHTATAEAEPAHRGPAKPVETAPPRIEPAADPASSARAEQPARMEAAPKPEMVAGADAAATPAPFAKAVTPADRKPVPPIENAATVKADAKAAPLVAPTRTAAVLPPGKAETVRAKAAEPSAFMSLPPEPAKPEPARAEATKPEPAKPTAAKRKPVQTANAKPPAPKPVAEASAAPAPVEAAPRPAPAQASDDSEVMGVKIPGSRHIRDGWKAVFGGDS